MFRLPRFLSNQRTPTASSRRRTLALEQLESRQVLSFTFNAGILLIKADVPNSNDSVKIIAAGGANDGTTGVQVRSNLVNNGAPTNIGGPGTPVVRIALDLQNGNDKVHINSLPQVKIRVGEGNGNNDIKIGDALDIAVAAGNGRNHVDLGAGLVSGGVAGIAPGNVLAFAGTAVLLGYSYTIDPTTGVLSTPFTPIGNNRSANDVKIRDGAGKTAVVDIASNGASSVHTGDGDDLVWIQGNGKNHIKVQAGNNQIQIDGNGNNDIDAKGTGSITVNGQGNNDIKAGKDSRNAVLLNFAPPGGCNNVKAAAGATVQVNGVPITKSGKVANTKTTVKFEPSK